MTPEYQALLKQLAADIVPIVSAAAKAAISDAIPVVGGIVATPVIDAVDAYIYKLLGVAVPSSAVTAPTDADARIEALEKHVAALTVATGNGTAQHMQVAKIALAPPPTPANTVAAAVAAAMPNAV